MTDQGLLLGCERCGSTLDRPGPLVFTSPNSEGYVQKVHLCAGCEPGLMGWINDAPNTVGGHLTDNLYYRKPVTVKAMQNRADGTNCVELHNFVGAEHPGPDCADHGDHDFYIVDRYGDLVNVDVDGWIIRYTEGDGTPYFDWVTDNEFREQYGEQP